MAETGLWEGEAPAEPRGLSSLARLRRFGRSLTLPSTAMAIDSPQIQRIRLFASGGILTKFRYGGKHAPTRTRGLSGEISVEW